MRRWLRRWAHLMMPGHGRMIFYDMRYGKRRWTYDIAGRIDVCRCGKRWYL